MVESEVLHKVQHRHPNHVATWEPGEEGDGGLGGDVGEVGGALGRRLRLLLCVRVVLLHLHLAAGELHPVLAPISHHLQLRCLPKRPPRHRLAVVHHLLEHFDLFIRSFLGECAADHTEGKFDARVGALQLRAVLVANHLHRAHGDEESLELLPAPSVAEVLGVDLNGPWAEGDLVHEEVVLERLPQPQHYQQYRVPVGEADSGIEGHSLVL
mmetsp:Transcript_42605/g.87075  ORF Transcript_42605/g.87075 Transcript_42605/m.87075 type:complete len:212 (-) Transcript_42605:1509-2144(-)